MSVIVEQIHRDFSNLSVDSEWDFPSQDEVYTHNYHRYPAKFIGRLANKIISEESEKGDVICDFFGGCGTSLVEAKLLGRQSIGFDINPVAKFIAQVKTKAIRPANLKREHEKLIERLEKNYRERVLIEPISPDSESFVDQRIRYWFSDEAYKDLHFIYNQIIQCQSRNIRTFFLCAFSQCLKNASRWLMKSIKPTVDKKKQYTDVRKSFDRHLNQMIKKNKVFYKELKDKGFLDTKSILYRGDTSKSSRLKKESMDLIITSPPYVTSYEYADLHQLTLLWFAHCADNFPLWKSYGDFRYFKSQFIGSSIALETTGCKCINSRIGKQIVANLRARNKGEASRVENYFHKMNVIFKRMHYALKRGKKACIVVGNTNLRGVEILNAQVALEQMLNIGFDNRYTIIKRNSMTNKILAPYRDKVSGRFTSLVNSNKVKAYHEEFVLKVVK